MRRLPGRSPLLRASGIRPDLRASAAYRAAAVDVWNPEALTTTALACRILDTATTRVLSADADSVTYDHVAIDAIIATTGALEVAEADPGAAVLLLRVILELLEELPAEAGHGALGDLLRQRAGANARAAGE